MTHPFVDTTTLRELSPVVIPEPPRVGEQGGPPCHACAKTDDQADVVWADARWRVTMLRDMSLAGVCLLEPRRHADAVYDLDDRERAELGDRIAMLQRALAERGPGVGRVGRVHVHVWGDGGAHLHVWFFPRPLGHLDLRGSFLVEWEEVLPKIATHVADAAADDLRRRLPHPDSLPLR